MFYTSHLKSLPDTLKIALKKIYYSKFGFFLHKCAVIVNKLIVLSPLWVPLLFVLVGVFKHVFFAFILLTWPILFDLVLPMVACGFAIMIFISRNPMYSLLSLLGVFFSMLLFYVASGVEFVGVVFLIVYVGAVAVLFLFVIMLLNVKSLTSKEKLVSHNSQIAAMFGVGLLYTQLQSRVINRAFSAIVENRTTNTRLEPTTAEAVFHYVRFQSNDINTLNALYSQHAALFFLITFILLSSLVGAIVLATATTERVTQVSDIRPIEILYSPLVFTLVVFPTSGSVLDNCAAIEGLLDTGGPFWISLMSVYDRRVNFGAHKYFLSNEQSDIAEHTSLRTRLHSRHLRRWRIQRKYLITKRRRERLLLIDVARRGSRALDRRFIIRERWFALRKLFLSKRLQVRLLQSAQYNCGRRRVARYTAIQPWRPRPLFWKWRSARAKYLYRITQHPTEKLLGERHYLPGDPQWDRDGRKVRGVIDPDHLGFWGYLKGTLHTRIAPWVVFWSWRLRSFTHFFGLYLIIIPHVVLPFYWLYNGLDTSIAQLGFLYKEVYHVLHVNIPAFEKIPEILRWLPVAAILWTAAAVKVILNHFWFVLIAAVGWAVATSALRNNRYIVDEDFETNSLKLEKFTNDMLDDGLQETDAERRIKLRHPDKKHSHFSLLPIVVVNATVEASTDGNKDYPTAFSTFFQNVYHDYVIMLFPHVNVPQPLVWFIGTLLICFFLHSVAELLLTIFWSMIYKNIPKPPTFVLRAFTLLPLSLILLIVFFGAQREFPLIDTISNWIQSRQNTYSRLSGNFKTKFELGLALNFTVLIILPLIFRLKWVRRFAQTYIMRPWGARTWYNYFIMNIPGWFIVADLSVEDKIDETIDRLIVEKRKELDELLAKERKSRGEDSAEAAINQLSGLSNTVQKQNDSTKLTK